MFEKQIYVERRKALKEKIGSGLILFFGNNEAPCNYPGNTYKYRQDSCFLYYFGLKRDGLAAAIDVDNDKEYVFGDDITLDNIVWVGYVPSVKELAATTGISTSAPMAELQKLVDKAKAKGQEIMFTPQCRYDLKVKLGDLVGLHPLKVDENASVRLIKAIVAQRTVKAPEEIEELKKAGEIGYMMHTTAQKECREGITETYLAGKIDGIAHSMGAMNSFPTILTMHGEIMHGMPKNVPLQAGRLMLCDAGGETFEHYCSDHTRTTPVSRKFTEQQKEIYKIVETAHDWIIEHAKIDVMWKDMQIGACKVITEHLKELGIMKGNADDAVYSGAHAAFLPCGIGHHMGLDVHDLEGLGQKYVGFDDEHPQSKQFGMKYLRYGIELKKNFIMTVEPGVYFIPHLLDDWKAKGLHKDFINFDACEKYRDFGGVRIENDVIITEKGAEFYCDKVAPYHLKDVEEFLLS